MGLARFLGIYVGRGGMDANHPQLPDPGAPGPGMAEGLQQKVTGSLFCPDCALF